MNNTTQAQTDTLRWPRRISGPMVVIGDVHGQTEMLGLLLKKILTTKDIKDRWIVFTGDFVDRGLSPAATIELVHGLRLKHQKVAAVMGNHDLALASSLGLVPTHENLQWRERYLNEGFACETTFESYNAKSLKELKANMPIHHQHFLKTLPWVVEHSHAIVVHAGLLPDQPISEQLAALHARATHTMKSPPWLCDSELHKAALPKDIKRTVISGHVPQKEVHVSKKRVLLDTGAGYAGALSAVFWPEGATMSVCRQETKQQISSN